MAHDGSDDRIAALLRAALRWESSTSFASVPHVAIVGGRYMPIGPLAPAPARRGAHRTPRSAVAGGRRIYAPLWSFGSGIPPPPHNMRFAVSGRHASSRAFTTADNGESASSSSDGDGNDDSDDDAQHRQSSYDTDSASTTDSASGTDTDDTSEDGPGNGDSDSDQHTDSDSGSSDEEEDDDSDSDPPHLTQMLNDAVTRSLDEVCASTPRPRQTRIDLPVRQHCTTQHGEGACAVCLDDFSDGDQVRSLPCAHAYHVTCIDRWLVDHDACPCCRAPVTRPMPHNDDGTPTFAIVHPVDPAPMPAWMNSVLERGACLTR
ncbi:Ring finger protein [Pandoravirus quercus]|uniref:Ring finger protein n=2 Tax=Pandoravirus TaxID=2060084 RepID=A0A2U7U8F1_9VIRU|nr:Ring finger protein [Pandoravirus quercus]AVK74706.1 Ring finger protein [Pandoravirus quercus]QBZ80882.1 Ring domain containing protein [Pandoravirus celtis]